MMTRKSRVEIEIYYDGGAVGLGLTTSARVAVLGADGSEGGEDAGAVSNGAMVARAGTEDAGT